MRVTCHVIGLCLSLGLTSCRAGGPSSAQPPRLQPLPQDPFVQVYFNHDRAFVYTDPYRQQTRLGTDLEQYLIRRIREARHSIVVAVQELRLPGIAHALAERHRAGISVRVVLENNYTQPLSAINPTVMAQMPERERLRYQEYQRFIDLNQDGHFSTDELQQRDALTILQTAGVPWLDDRADGSAGSNLMHHKFMVIDRHRLIVTSANFTLSDIHGDLSQPESRGNANNLLSLDSQELAALFLEEFELLWGDGPGGQPNSRFGVQKPYRPPRTVHLGNSTITLHFSPTSAQRPWEQSSNGLIHRTLATATQAVDLALFVFSEQRLANVLEERSQQGVAIRALIDPGFAYRPYSEALDMLGVSLSQNCRLETENRPWSRPLATVGVPRLPKGDLLHHKFALVDRTIIITGSHNWSKAANLGNDETLIILANPIVAAHYQREFDRLYNMAFLGLPTAVQQKVEADRHQCQRSQTSAQPWRNFP